MRNKHLRTKPSTVVHRRVVGQVTLEVVDEGGGVWATRLSQPGRTPQVRAPHFSLSKALAAGNKWLAEVAEE